MRVFGNKGFASLSFLPLWGARAMNSFAAEGLAGTVIVFILSLGFYVTPAFLGAPGDRVLAIVIGEVFGRQRDLALASAMGVLMLLAVLVLYFVSDRLLRISEQWERF